MPNLYDNDGFIDNVTRWNNTQNVVKVSDFRSNDNIQLELGKNFSKINDIDGKQYFYINKRGKDIGKRNIKKIFLEDFCKKLFAFKKGPIDCYKGIKHLFDDKVDGGYFLLFGDKEEEQIYETLTESKFNEYASIYFLCETTENYFKEIKSEREEIAQGILENDDKPNVVKSALKSKYHIYYLVGIFFKEFARKENITLEEFLINNKFYKPKVWRKKESYGVLIKGIINVCCDVWVQQYTDCYDRSINHRNWLRIEENILQMKAIIQNSRISDIVRLYAEYKQIS